VRSKPRYIGIAIARAIVSGDVQSARELARNVRSYRVCEARAIHGAIGYAAAHYGAILSFADFFAAL
jgi:hypothetical protein